MASDLIVYTAIFGMKDELHAPQIVEPGVRYISFSDRRYPAKVWKQNIVAKNHALGPNLQAKEYKLFPEKFLPKHRYSIWIDGKYEIQKNPFPLWRDICILHPLSLFKHTERDCLYKEGGVCLQLRLDRPDIILSQLLHYNQNGFPEQAGLSDNALILRQSECLEVENLMVHWWEEIRKWSKRDQLSFQYACWKYGVEPNILDHEIRDVYLYRKGHLK